MSFLRREKSRSNLKSSFGFGLSNSNPDSNSKKSNHEDNRSQISIDNPDSPSPIAQSQLQSPHHHLNPPNHQGSISSQGQNKLAKKASQSSIAPTISSSVSSINSSSNFSHNNNSTSYNRRDSPGFPFNARYDEQDSLMFDDNSSQNKSPATKTISNNDVSGNTSSPNHQYFHNRSNLNQNEDCSPRSSIISLNRSRNNSESDLPNNRSPNNKSNDYYDYTNNLKDNYKGFHSNRRSKGINIPPLSHPIKPKFKKKSGSLLGKLIYSTTSRKDSDASNYSNDSQNHTSNHLTSFNPPPNVRDFDQNDTRNSNTNTSSRQNSVGSSGNNSSNINQHNRKSVSSSGSANSGKHKFRIPSLNLHNNQSQNNQQSDRHDTNQRLVSTEGSFNNGKMFDLDINLNELHDIVKPPTDRSNKNSVTSSENYSPTDSNSRSHYGSISDSNDKNSSFNSNKNNQRLPTRRSFTSLGNLKNMTMTPATKSFDQKNVGVWKAPDSWDVKIENPNIKNDDDSFTDSEEAEDDDGDQKSLNSNNDKKDHYEFSGNKVPDSLNLNGDNSHLIQSSELKDDQQSMSSTSSANLNNRVKGSSNTKPSSNPGSTSSTPGYPKPIGTTSAGASFTPHSSNKRQRSKHADDNIDLLSTRTHLPVLYGSRQRSHVANASSDAASHSKKGPNHIVRIFKEDNTFTTILCPLETTTADLLTIVQRKFFLESTSNYQITVYIGNCVKVLEPFEKPLKIQMGLLMLSGYVEKDNLKIIGREDLSFICKFVVENIMLRSLTHEEETILSKDYVDVNISSLNLKNIPIIFHQHTYEIERLVVSDNPSIYIPLDFIQSCNNLTSIVFAHNGCSRFPTNFLEARKLTHLDLEQNFLDELPSKFSHLKNLSHLKLNSNQLSTLPKSFGKLANLTVLNLSSNYFNHYPEAISELRNLKDLDLSYNDLSVIPPSIGKLTKLSKLNLCTNKLSKSLPSCFTNLVSLKRLDIRYNKISNVDVLGSLPNLEVTYASKNNISAFSDKMESLRLLHFDRNPITNLEFQNLLPLLTVLDLSKAKLTSIPAEFISKIPHIEKLVLDKNHLVNLPEELGNLNKLTSLSLFGNNLQVLPSTIGKLTSLQFLDLHSNNLQLLPDDIWNLKSLSVLNVSSNILTSFPKPPLSVAKRISSSANFISLAMEKASSDEQLRPSIHSPNENDEVIERSTENIPTLKSGESHSPERSFSLSDSLLVLTLADNRLTDECFESISILVGLKSLNLSYNDILEIPEGALRRLTRLTELYLSGNELTNLPADDIENIKALKLLFLNNNKMVALPAELSKLVNLQHLDVGSNQLKYNISNWPYDWNWHWNQKLRYLNFSGNKRFEIKQSHIKNPDTGEDYDSLLVLKELKVLGLIDVTLTTTSVPDQNVDMRIRTTASELETIGYGVSDSMGMRDVVSSRDIFIQKFRGNENEVLICSFDGKSGAPHKSHRISHLAKSLLVPSFTNELNRLGSNEDVHDAIRRTFLTLNKEINSILASQKTNNYTPPSANPDLASLNLIDDAKAGCSVAIIYIKDKRLYTANIGDIEALLSKNNGDYTLLTQKHDPTNRPEFERIRASGGYVSGDGALDGILPVSRGVGFFQYLPHTHSGPDIKDIELTAADDMIILASKVFWDYVSYDLAVDILRQEKDDPMIAAQKLRDYAICYGATDKIAVMVITLGQQKSKKFGSNSLYHNLGRENDLFTNKKRRDRAIQPGDLALRRLEDEIEPPVGDLALVFTDIKNSTLLWDTYPVAMRSAIKLHNTIMRRQLRIVGGYEVKTEGDAFMVSFPSPTSALLWCFNVQHQLLTEDWPTEILETDQCCEVTDGKGNVIFRGLSVRMGVHWGSPVCELDMVTRRMDYFGPMVNRASRVSAIADGGQIAMSSDFCDEIKNLYEIHEKIEGGKTTISEAYQGNVLAGEIIEREIHSLEENGCSYFELGEKKLKGLETPELVTLVFPKKLEVRFEIFQQRLSKDEDIGSATRVVGALPVQSIYGLRTVSLKLENLCSSMSGGYHVNEGFQKNSSGIISEKINTDFKESDLISLFNHIVTRIENCVVILELRQRLNEANGHKGKIDFVGTKNIMAVLQEFSNIMAENASLKAAMESRKQSGYVEEL